MRTLLRQYALDDIRSSKAGVVGHDVPDVAVGTDGRLVPSLNYDVKTDQLEEPLRSTFLPSRMDEETRAFIDRGTKRRYLSQWVSDVLYGSCLSRTSANALTFRGGMFVLSGANARRLLFQRNSANEQRFDQRSEGDGADIPQSGAMVTAKATATAAAQLLGEALLDIGAGDGGVTQHIAPFFRRVFATEASLPMQYRLWWRGFDVPPSIDAVAPFDCVSLFNVLDRCDRPLSLLRDMRRWVKPDGTVIVAVVLPWCPFVEDGNRQRPPTEELPMSGVRCGEHPTFEASAEAMYERVLRPVGFRVRSWTRVPYVCEGSPSHQFYALDNAVFVLDPVAPVEPTL